MTTLIGEEEGNIEANEAMSKEKEEAKESHFIPNRRGKSQDKTIWICST